MQGDHSLVAQFKMELPTQIIDDCQWIEENTYRIFGGMTRIGAETALGTMLASCPNKDLVPYGRITKTYKTPSDGGINTKAGFWGYLPFSNPNRKYFTRRANGGVYSTDKGVPVDFLVKLYEYGRSTAPFPKHPFVRKAFSPSKITKAMYQAQSDLSRGLLDEGFTPINDPNNPW